jgi:hypothetical protein
MGVQSWGLTYVVFYHVASLPDSPNTTTLTNTSTTRHTHTPLRDTHTTTPTLEHQQQAHITNDRCDNDMTSFGSILATAEFGVLEDLRRVGVEEQPQNRCTGEEQRDAKDFVAQ